MKQQSAAAIFPCSQAERRFWFEEQLHPGNSGLNVAVRWRLDGSIDATDLAYAWSAILERHEILRTTLVESEGEPVQVVHAGVSIDVPEVDLRALDFEAASAEADRIADAEAHRIFDLTVAPLVRVKRVILRDDVSIVLVTAHHAVCDGWSIGILARDMGELIAARHAGRLPVLPELATSYREYAEAERARAYARTPGEEIALTSRFLRDYRQFELLPDYPRPRVQTSNGTIDSLLLDRALTDRLVNLARENACTTFMAAYAALVITLHRFSGETDIAIGTQVVGRDDVELEELVGCFINTIPLRTDLSGNPSFAEFLGRVGEMIVDTFEIRDFPLERLIEIANPKRDLSRNALFSVNFIFQRSFVENAKYERFSLTDLPSRSAGALYDLNFFMVERPEGWRASCEYNRDLYAPSTIASVLATLHAVLEAIVENPAAPISTLPVLNDAQRNALVLDANRTERAYPETTFPALFAAQAARTPDAVALTCEGSTLTYAELERASGAVARGLRSRGIAPGERVGVFMERSTDLVVALVGVLRSGSAYVPLDPAYPEGRVAYIARHARLAALVSSERTRGSLVLDGRPEMPVLDLDALRADRADASEPLPEPGPGDAAYAIYTSGSTGRPKGVEVPHRALANFVQAMRERPGIGPDDTLVAVTTISFDIAALELFLPLTVGARVAIATPREATDGETLANLVRRENATMMQATPVTWQLLLEARWRPPAGFKMLCGGEAMPRSLAQRLLENDGELWNMYGPTETTIWSSSVRVTSGVEPVPIGPPIANTQFYVVDAFGNLVPFGAPGELLIGGDGVANGYIDDPNETGRRFVPDRFRNVPDARVYRTGDVVRRRDGNLEFLGRNDNQIKLRGFRIELGEIESALDRQPDVVEAAVGVCSDKTSLCAYVVAAAPVPDETAWCDGIRVRLRDTLPSYMIPKLFVTLPALPRTPNGKLDRGALPEPARPATVTVRGAKPRTPTEAAVAGFVADLLGRSDVPIDEDVFGLGFHSLLAVKLVSRINETFGVKVPLRALFDNPTVAGLAESVDERSAGGTAPLPSDAAITTLNANGSRPPLIYLHSDVFAGGMYSRRLAARLGADQPIVSIAPHGTADLPFYPTIEVMARDYVARIKQVLPAGPYRLGGFCVSGLVAYEIGRLLMAGGDVVEDVILINSSALPTKTFGLLDGIVRVVATNQSLSPRLRETICYNVARLNAAVATGPLATVGFVATVLRSIASRKIGTAADVHMDPEPFAKIRGTPETETFFAHLASALTYHPRSYRGRITLIWGIEQPSKLREISRGWSKIAPKMRSLSMLGGHVSPLHGGLEALAESIERVLAT